MSQSLISLDSAFDNKRLISSGCRAPGNYIRFIYWNHMRMFRYHLEEERERERRREEREILNTAVCRHYRTKLESYLKRRLIYTEIRETLLTVSNTPRLINTRWISSKIMSQKINPSTAAYSCFIKNTHSCQIQGFYYVIYNCISIIYIWSTKNENHFRIFIFVDCLRFMKFKKINYLQNSK